MADHTKRSGPLWLIPYNSSASPKSMTLGLTAPPTLLSRADEVIGTNGRMSASGM